MFFKENTDRNTKSQMIFMIIDNLSEEKQVNSLQIHLVHLDSANFCEF
jgi:hypothetical protein